MAQASAVRFSCPDGEATLAEIALANTPKAIEERDQEYPQRRAVLNALQGLLEHTASKMRDGSRESSGEQRDPTTILGDEP